MTKRILSAIFFFFFFGQSIGGKTDNIRPGSCGQTSVPNRATLSRAANQRIVGGYEAKPHSVPWIISIRTKSGSHWCGGTLIRVNDKSESDIVVTAAHCLGWMSPGNATFDVVAGAHYRTQKETGEQRVAAAQTVVHPNYKPSTSTKQANDLAIIKLAQPIKFSPTVQPACLPKQNEAVADNVYGLVAGWGDEAENGNDMPDALRQVTVPILNTEKCSQMYSGFITPTAMLCAGFETGKFDACQGDSGGPYVLEGQNGYTLQGVVSWGGGCARAKSPGVYTRVASYVDWIQTQAKQLTSI